MDVDNDEVTCVAEQVVSVSVDYSSSLESEQFILTSDPNLTSVTSGLYELEDNLEAESINECSVYDLIHSTSVSVTTFVDDSDLDELSSYAYSTSTSVTSFVGFEDICDEDDEVGLSLCADSSTNLDLWRKVYPSTLTSVNDQDNISVDHKLRITNNIDNHRLENVEKDSYDHANIKQHTGYVDKSNSGTKCENQDLLAIINNDTSKCDDNNSNLEEYYNNKSSLEKIKCQKQSSILGVTDLEYHNQAIFHSHTSVLKEAVAQDDKYTCIHTDWRSNEVMITNDNKTDSSIWLEWYGLASSSDFNETGYDHNICASKNEKKEGYCKYPKRNDTRNCITLQNLTKSHEKTCTEETAIHGIEEMIISKTISRYHCCEKRICHETEDSYSCQEIIIYPLKFLLFSNDEQSNCLVYNQKICHVSPVNIFQLQSSQLACMVSLSNMMVMSLNRGICVAGNEAARQYCYRPAIVLLSDWQQASIDHMICLLKRYSDLLEELNICAVIFFGKQVTENVHACNETCVIWFVVTVNVAAGNSDVIDLTSVSSLDTEHSLSSLSQTSCVSYLQFPIQCSSGSISPVDSDNFTEGEAILLSQDPTCSETIQSYQSLCSIDGNTNENLYGEVQWLLETASPETDSFPHQMASVAPHSLCTSVDCHDVHGSSSVVVCIPGHCSGAHPNNSELQVNNLEIPIENESSVSVSASEPSEIGHEIPKPSCSSNPLMFFALAGPEVLQDQSVPLSEEVDPFIKDTQGEMCNAVEVQPRT